MKAKKMKSNKATDLNKKMREYILKSLEFELSGISLIGKCTGKFRCSVSTVTGVLSDLMVDGKIKFNITENGGIYSLGKMSIIEANNLLKTYGGEL